MALRALKVATDRTKTHFKGAQDYLMTMDNKNSFKGRRQTTGYTKTAMFDKDLIVASILD